MKFVRIFQCMVAGALACGVPLWLLPYEKVELLSRPHPLLWLALGASAGILSGYLIRPGLAIPAHSVAAGYVAATLGRVAFEPSRDPTSHNLWPFEIVIAGGFGAVAGFAGVVIARAIQRKGAAS